MAEKLQDKNSGVYWVMLDRLIVEKNIIVSFYISKINKKIW